MNTSTRKSLRRAGLIATLALTALGAYGMSTPAPQAQIEIGKRQEYSLPQKTRELRPLTTAQVVQRGDGLERIAQRSISDAQLRAEQYRKTSELLGEQIANMQIVINGINVSTPTQDKVKDLARTLSWDPINTDALYCSDHLGTVCIEPRIRLGTSQRPSIIYADSTQSYIKFDSIKNHKFTAQPTYATMHGSDVQWYTIPAFAGVAAVTGAMVIEAVTSTQSARPRAKAYRPLQPQAPPARSTPFTVDVRADGTYYAQAAHESDSREGKYTRIMRKILEQQG